MNPMDEARHVGVVNSWLGEVYANGLVTNPTNNYAVCVTAAIPAGFYDVHAFAASSVSMGGETLVFERRDAVNQSTWWWCGVQSTGNATTQFYFTNIKILAGEFLRWYVRYGFTGNVQCLILAACRG